MKQQPETLLELLRVVGELETLFGVQRNVAACNPLLFVGVTDAQTLERLHPVVEQHFGPPMKRAGGETFTDKPSEGFVRAIGGVRLDQTLFLSNVVEGHSVYCVFWPWGSNPLRVSIRVGVIAGDDGTAAALAEQLQPVFDALPKV